MAASSPYIQNDYQALSTFRPYRLPVNDAIGALAAENQFWEEGARRVKAYYDNALDLKLSLEPNKKIRDEYLQQAEKELTKLSSQNLSDPDVQRKGFSIFKPLFEDEGVMSDDQATRAIMKTESDINNARTLENGKFYSDTNAMVALDGTYEFRTSKDRMAGKTYLQKKKDYKPYYDPTKEFTDIVKGCKGPTLGSSRPGEGKDMYLHTQEVSGANASRLQLCLESGLSQRAKDQINIDGYAAYMSRNRVDHPEGKNYQALRDDYIAAGTSTLQSIDQNIKDLDGKIAAYQAVYDQTKDGRYLDLKKAAEDAKEGYLNRGKNIQNSFDNVAAGNMDFIKNNYEQLAHTIHTSKRLASFAEAFRNDSELDKYSADAVKLQAQRLTFQEALENSRQKHDIVMEGLEHENKMKEIAAQAAGKGKKVDAQGNEVYTPTNPALTDANKTIATNGYSEFVKEKENITSKLRTANLELFNTLKRKYPNELNNYTFETFFQDGQNGISPAMSFLDTGGRFADDPAVEAWGSQTALLTNQMAVMNTQEELNEAQIKTDNKELFGVLDKVKPTTFKGQQFTANDVINLLNGQTVGGLKYVTNYKGLPVYKPGKGSTVVDHYEDAILNENNEVIAHKDPRNLFVKSFIGGDDFGRLLNEASRTNGEASSKLMEARNNLYGQSLLEIRPTVFADANNADELDPVRMRVSGAVGLGVGKADIQNVSMMWKDPTTGDAAFQVTGSKEKPLDSEGLIKNLQTAGFNVDKLENFDPAKYSASFVIKGIPDLVDQRTLDNPFTVLQLHLDRLALGVNSPTSKYNKIEVGQSITKIPFITKTIGGNDFIIDVIRTSNGVKYEVQGKAKKDVTNQQGEVIQEKGKYYPTQQTFNEANKLLSWLNGSQR